MNKIHGKKDRKKIVMRILMIPVLALLLYGAARLGIMGGNYLYSLDIKVVENVDTNYFKSALNFSLPIINTVYNSGNAGFSLADDMKKLLGGIFNFDMDYPTSIFNTQSALFYSYYRDRYITEQFADGKTTEQLPESKTTPTPTPESPGNQGPVVQAPTGIPGGNTSEAPTPGAGTGTNTGKEQAGSEPAGQEGSLEPTSSIVFEEDEIKNGKGDVVSHDKVVVQNHSSYKINIEELLNAPFEINFSKKGPQVLIYHTHTRESYVLKASDLGKRNIPLYNNNPKYSVVRVGEELSRYLKKYGIDVLHNGTVHDYNHPSAYSASLKTLKEYTKSYPSLKIFFDVHRDGLAANQPKMRVTTKINKKTVAQIMFVVGTGGSRLPHPKWKENLKLALKLQQALNEKYPGLARPIYISNSRYNQHISEDALIIEIGGDGNLLDECVESTKYLAEAVNTVIKEN